MMNNSTDLTIRTGDEMLIRGKNDLIATSLGLDQTLIKKEVSKGYANFHGLESYMIFYFDRAGNWHYNLTEKCDSTTIVNELFVEISAGNRVAWFRKNDGQIIAGWYNSIEQINDFYVIAKSGSRNELFHISGTFFGQVFLSNLGIADDKTIMIRKEIKQLKKKSRMHEDIHEWVGFFVCFDANGRCIADQTDEIKIGAFVGARVEIRQVGKRFGFFDLSRKVWLIEPKCRELLKLDEYHYQVKKAGGKVINYHLIRMFGE